MLLVNERTNATIASQVELASTRRQRRRGLLGRDGLAAGSALVLTPCAAIHTAFMRFAIDVLFLDRQGRAVRVARRLKPWRLAMAPTARVVVELPAGELDGADLRAGDRLTLVPAP